MVPRGHLEYERRRLDVDAALNVDEGKEGCSRLESVATAAV